jgi:hypothetical protein
MGVREVNIAKIDHRCSSFVVIDKFQCNFYGSCPNLDKQ